MPISRRNFLLATGGATAAAATAGGSKLVNKLIPYVNPPRNAIPGEWTAYSTTCRECPAGCGMRVSHIDGRATKAEGNPSHPVNRGGLCPRGQSSLQGLYDPDRVRTPLKRAGKTFTPVSWEEALRTVAAAAAGAGGKTAVISDMQTGSLLETMGTFLRSRGSDRILLYEPFSWEAIRKAHAALFGVAAVPTYHLERAQMVLSFGSDFLEAAVNPVGHARGFSAMHGFVDGSVGRFVYVGPRMSMTAANADDLHLVEPGSERWVALAILKAMAVEGMSREAGRAWEIALAAGARNVESRCSLAPGVITALARAFASSRGVALAVRSGDDSAEAADAAFAAALLNVASGSINSIVDFSRRHAAGRSATRSETEAFLDSLSADSLLVIHNTNIVYTLPSAREKLRRPKTVVYLGTLPDETAELADLVLPIDSPLESWGDYEPCTGLVSLMQPTMARLHDTRSAGDIFLSLSGSPSTSFEEWHRGYWEKRNLPAPLSSLLREGSVSVAVPPLTVHSGTTAGTWRLAPVPPAPKGPAEAILAPWGSIMLHDGRTANRGWLQETPDPVTTAVWGNWIDIHRERAKGLDLRDGDLVRMEAGGAAITLPVRITEEIHPSAVGVSFGQGHSAAGLSRASGIGENAFLLSGSRAVVLTKTGKKGTAVFLSATTEQHGRGIIRTAAAKTLGRMEIDDADRITLPLPEGFDPARDLYQPHEHRKHRWGMVVDLQKCIGCGACAVACQAENNVPVVGRTRAAQGREMAWLKVVPYGLEGSPHRLRWLPLLCQHCDSAPCETVCPVFAAVHSEEGLNAQIYNRCIGTRYCSNNCPYKVRRFNWLQTEWRAPLELQLNPEVTVRSRGVMEKCTFCVQRIRRAEYRARLDGRPLSDGEVQPACAESCPTGAYTFGDLMDPASRVSQLVRNDPRRYQVLHELNTKPAVVYLKAVTLEPVQGGEKR